MNAVTFAEGWTAGLLSLADYLEAAMGDPLFTGGDRATANTLRFAARMARERARLPRDERGDNPGHHQVPPDAQAVSVAPGRVTMTVTDPGKDITRKDRK